MRAFKTGLLAATAIMIVCGTQAFAASGSVNTATVTTVTPPVQTMGAGATTDVATGAIDDSSLPAGFPGSTATPGHDYSELLQAVESDGSGANAVINGEGHITLDAFDDGEVNSSQIDMTGTAINALTGSATITTTGGTTINGGMSLNGGLNNNGGGITNVGAITGITSISTTGAATFTGGITTSTLTTTGLATLDSLSVTHDADIHGALSVDGMATLSGGATITGGAGKSLVVDAGGTTANGGAALWSGTGSGNSIVVDGTSSRLVDASGTNSVSVGANGVAGSGNGGTLALNGATAAFTNINSQGLSVDASSTALTGGGAKGNSSKLFLNASTASLTTQDGSGMTATQGGAVSVVGAKGSGTQRASMLLGPSGENVSLLNNTGHGIATTANSTVVSGGTSSTSLTLNDSGASFATDGGPSRVTGVANGVTRYDAVNMGQLDAIEKKASGGVAMASALAGMPQVEPGKTFGVALGGGYFDGQGAGSLGVSFRERDDAVFKLGVASSMDGNLAVNGGVGISW